MKETAFVTCDVFTETPFGGNPLAVFPDARGLDPDLLQTIAAEFNLSETVFAWPVENAPLTRRLRIFNPTYEMPFAGHPTVGAAIALAELGLFPWPQGQRALEIVLEEGVGPVPVRIERRAGRPLRATLSAPKLPERGPDGPDAEGLARVLGLAPERLSPTLAPACYGAGLPFSIEPLRDAGALAEIAVDPGAWRALMSGAWAKALFAVTFEEEGEIRARMFAPAMGISEDPATGAAAVAIAGFLADLRDAPREGRRAWTVRQGEEMGRPSRIALEADFAGGRLAAVRVGGAAVMMTRGTLQMAGG